ncbi:MAG: tail fiber domain-containing protein [Flavobacteriales bacterium]|nr:tail fiber domain-containing protein [Flavobacteriales bacterium]
MKTNRIFGLYMGLFSTMTGWAQIDWNLGGNTVSLGTDYLGCDVNSSEPLHLRTIPALPIDLSTSDVHRFRLLPDATYANLGNFTNIVANGYALLSPKVGTFLSTRPGPYTLLHLADDQYADQSLSFREWMRIGLTLTGNFDHTYHGLKYRGEDLTDMIAHWSDNPGRANSPDRYRFLFTSEYDAQTFTGATSWEGLEAMRLYPHNFDEVFIGLGDWYAANYYDPTIVEPEERLDIVNGRVRIRQLPTDPDTDDDKVMVVDDDGVVHWRPFADFVSANGCEWTMNTSSPNHVYTAVGAADPDCPDENEFVGIGTATPAHKLHVMDAIPDGGGNNTACVMISKAAAGSTNSCNYTLQVEASQNTGQIYAAKAVSGSAYDGTVFNVGVTGYGYLSTGASNSNYIAGVEGIATGSSAQSINALEGVRGVVNVDYGSYFAAGVMGVAHQAGTSTYAGYFVGDVHITGDLTVSGSYPTSDAGLKQNVAPLSNAMAVVQQLEPKTYSFIQGLHPGLNLPSGDQAGLIAQQVDMVVPGLTKTFTVPAEVDSSGAILNPSIQYMGLNYTGLIPYLIGAIKEQQQQINTLQSIVMNCCSITPEGSGPRSLNGPTPGLTPNETKLTIQPNPIMDRTTVSYTLERSGQLLLVVNTATGRQVQVLREGAAEAGSYT